VAEPELIPTAIEEFLRAYAPVSMAREIAKETQIGNCAFKEGEMVLLSFPAANRDPAVFPEPDRVIVEPRSESPCRVRGRHSPLRRLRSGAHGDEDRS
jgi:cytochrome P450